jgi:uncharacterized protein (DUF2141 family)
MTKPAIRLVILVSLALAALEPAEAVAQVAATAPATGCTLRIHVDGLRNEKGDIGSVIFASADGWPEDTNKALRHGPTPIDAGKRGGTVVWENLPAGDYGVAVIHDENMNHKLDKNFLGIPKEGFGFANNPHVGMSAPPFSAAIVHVACPATEITVHMQYK